MRRFGEIALLKGYLTKKQLLECLREQQLQSRDGKPETIGSIAVRKGYITREQVGEILKEQGKAIPGKIARYRVLEKIGQGAMGAVFKATDEATGNTVALKILSPRLARSRAFIKRFLREAQAGATLRHPNIVQTLDVGEAGGYYYLAMEFVEGETARHLLREKGVFEEKEALKIVAQICQALEHARNHNMVHRDVKPENILISKDGTAKLADLGLAREVSTDPSLTVPGEALGTPFYISPEQAQGKVDVDHRSDVYSLGATLFHLVTGKVPFEGATSAVVMTKHINEPLPEPRSLNSSLTESVSNIIKKAMAKTREERYRNAGEMLRDIKRALSGQPVQPPAPSPKERISTRLEKKQKAQRRKTVIVSIFVLLAFAYAFYRMRSSGKTTSGVPPTTSVSATVSASTTIPGTRKVPPSALADSPAKKSYETALQYATRNPYDLKTIQELFKAVKEKFPATEWAHRAETKLTEIEIEYNKSARKEYEKVRERVSQSLSKGNYGGAISALDHYLDSPRFSLSPAYREAQTERQELFVSAKNLVKEKIEEAKRKASEGRFALAYRLLDEAMAVGLTDLLREIDTTRTLIENAEKKHGLQAEEKKFVKLRASLIQLIDRGELDSVSKSVEQALSQVWRNPDYSSELKSLDSGIRTVRQIISTAKERLKKLLGTREKIRLKGFTGTVESFDGESITLRVGTVPVRMSFSKLLPEDIFSLSGCDKNTPDSPLKRGLYFLFYVRDFGKAGALFNSSPEIAERSKPYLSLINELTLASLDREAEELFNEARRLASQGKSTLSVKKLNLLLSERFIRTNFVKAHRSEIEELIEKWESATELLRRKEEKPVPFKDITSSAGELGALSLNAPEGQWAGSALWADFDGDGKLDLLWGRGGYSFKGGWKSYIFIQKKGQFVEALRSKSDISHAAVADANLDGRLEILVSNGWQTQLHTVYLKRGMLNLETYRLPDRLPGGLITLGWAELNADTYPDAIFSSRDRLHALVNGRGRHFEELSRKQLPDELIGGRGHRLPGNLFFSTVDLNFDGYTDILLNAREGLLVLSRGERFELFPKAPKYNCTATTDKRWGRKRLFDFGTAWADYDNDGDFDVFVSQKGDPRLFRNDGSAGFVDVTDDSGDIVKLLANVQSCAWADINFDGWIDLLVASEDVSLRLFINNGDGTFTDQTRLWGLAGYTDIRHIATADFDDDGDIDIFLNRDGGDSRLLLNQFATPQRAYFVKVVFKGQARIIGTIVKLSAKRGRKERIWGLRMLGSQRGLSDQEPIDQVHFGVPTNGKYEVEILTPGRRRLRMSVTVSPKVKGGNVIVIKPRS